MRPTVNKVYIWEYKFGEVLKRKEKESEREERMEKKNGRQNRVIQYQTNKQKYKDLQNLLLVQWFVKTAP